MTIANLKETSALVDLRKRAGLTQKKFAALLEDAFGRSVTETTVSAWERGRHKPRLTPGETLKLCTILSCTLDELVEATSNNEQK